MSFEYRQTAAGAGGSVGLLSNTSHSQIYSPLGYERVYLPLCKVADTPFHIQGDELANATVVKRTPRTSCQLVKQNELFANE